MEISVIGSSQVNLGRIYDGGLFSFGKNLSAQVCNLKSNNSNASFLVQNQRLTWSSKSCVGFTLRASAAASPTPDTANSEKAPKTSRTKHVDGIKLFVGLPLDTVSISNKPTRPRAISAGLKALKLLGVDGVELPVWWGIAEKESMGKYDWTSYLSVVQMVQKLGLEVHVSLCFHASRECGISLPDWVSRVGEGDPGLYFSDRLGQQYNDCLSFGVDEIPVLDGKTPVEVYKEFGEGFKRAFEPYIGSTITGISTGLGPNGELRYPSHHQPDKSNHGGGEFQCYDKYMLSNLKRHAEANGTPLRGPDQSLLSGGPHGDFFLSWYSSQLAAHGDRILSLASKTFEDAGVSVSGKVPVVHPGQRTQSCPAGLSGRDCYEAIAEVFSRNSCGMTLPGMNLPESLLEEITSSCWKHGVMVAGENGSDSDRSGGFERIKKNLLDENSMVHKFTYQRMGASFFSPERFTWFAHLARSLSRPVEGRDDGFRLGSSPRMQTA